MNASTLTWVTQTVAPDDLRKPDRCCRRFRFPKVPRVPPAYGSVITSTKR